MPRICPSAEDLSRLVSGALSEADLQSLMEHVDYCPDCQRRVEQVESADPLDQQLAKLRDHQPQRTDAIFLNRWHRSAAGRHKSFTLPTEIGPYRLLRTIASGGMGTVYDARHRRLGRPFAFKLLHVGGRISRGEAQRIKSEWRTHGRLSHPNIVAATDAGVVDGQPYLVTERVEGIDLSSLVRSQGPLTPADACELIRQAATGLQYVHDQQIVHGDVKPSNLMLSTGGVVKLLDLGTAKQLDVAGFDGLERATTHGTLAYMAPEQLTHRESAVSGGASPENYRSDIYSLGCTLYFLLTSQPPFGNQQESSNQELIEAHRSQPPPQIVGLASDDPLHRLLDRTLAKDPADRPQSMQELIEELEPLSRGHDVAELLSGWRTERIDQVETDASLFELTHGLTALLKIHRRRFPWSIVAAALLVIGGAVWWMTRDAIVGDTTSVATAEPSVGDAASIAVAAQPYTARTSYGEDILNFDNTWKPSPRSGTLDGLVLSPARLDGIEQWQIETIAPRGRIRSLRWSPDGTKIATVSSDGHIRIFDWRGNQLSLVQLIAHRDYRFESVDFHRHAAQLFATTASRLVRADITDGKIVAEANIADVSSMQWVDGIDRIAVASPAGVELRNPTNLQRTAMLPGRYKHVCWSGDGKRCAYLSKGSVWVHPLRNGTFAAKPLGRRRLRATPQGLTLSPSKSHLAIVFADRVEVMNRDSATPAISVASPQRLESVAFGDTDAKLVFGTYAGVAQLRATRLGGPEFRHQAWGRSQVAWNPRGDLIAVGQRGLLRIVDPQLKTIHKIGAVKSVRSAQQIGSGQTVILFRSGKIVCTDAGGKIIGWSTFLPDGRRVAERLLTSARPNRVSVGISDGGFQPMDIGIPIAGLDAAAATDRQTPLVRRLHDGSRFVVEIWDQHAQRWQTFWKSKERISCAEVSPDGRRVAVLSGSQTLNLIDPSSGQLLLQRKLAELRFQNQYFWIDNRSLLVAGAANMTARNLARYEIDGDRWVWTVQEPHDATAAEVIRLDEATFLQAGSVHFVRSLSDGQPLETIDVESHYGRRHGRLYRDADSPHYFSWGYPFGLSYDANSSDGIVCWDAQTFKPQWLLTDLGEAETVSLSPAGQIISATPGAIEQLIWIVDTDTGRALLNREEFQLQL